uniref:Uncharacterized protein n=1 Tax=Siphoviridae sp. ctmpG14 TaxID=2825654 RepID=A0A8S5PDB5_9CAUD|nr:MAG TPA: hypothetical protein [Siphoviridae sp. ctmpG14]
MCLFRQFTVYAYERRRGDFFNSIPMFAVLQTPSQGICFISVGNSFLISRNLFSQFWI